MPTVAGNCNHPCGMLKFNINTIQTDKVKITYVASHPLLLANYFFSIVKGANTIYTTSGPVACAPFVYEDTVANLLGTCQSAAFAAQLYVAATAINGISRQSQYDASRTVAFP